MYLYYKTPLHVQTDKAAEDTIMPQADDQGPACLEEVFIKELFVF
jgi:hypothetical protein